MSNDFYNLKNFESVTEQQKENSKNLAIEYFSKDSEVNKSGYRKLLNSFANKYVETK